MYITVDWSDQPIVVLDDLEHSRTVGKELAPLWKAPELE